MKSEKMVDGYATDALNLMIILLTSIFVVDNIIFFPFITISLFLSFLLQSEKPSLKYVIEGYLCIHSGIQSVDNVSIRY